MTGARLLIETSGRAGSVGLSVNDRLLRRDLDASRRHNRDLAPAVQSLLSEADLAPRDVAEVLVSVGPGSYTGLRVGVVSGKAWAYATGANLVAVPTFAIHAEQSPPQWGEVDIVSDGLQGLIYLQEYRHFEGTWRPAGELRIVRATEWASSRSPTRAVAGPAVALVEPLITPDAPRPDEAGRVPSLAAMPRLAGRFPALSRDELFALEPTYLRGSSAEEQAARKAKGGG